MTSTASICVWGFHRQLSLWQERSVKARGHTSTALQVRPISRCHLRAQICLLTVCMHILWKHTLILPEVKKAREMTARPANLLCITCNAAPWSKIDLLSCKKHPCCKIDRQSLTPVPYWMMHARYLLCLNKMFQWKFQRLKPQSYSCFTV